MYLRTIYIENNGALRLINLEIQLKQNGTPKPMILVGGNGSGKTNFLSLIADALFEIASVHFSDVVAAGQGIEKPWFRVLGGTTISVGALGSCGLLHFDHDGQTLFYQEKSGTLSINDVIERVPEVFKSMPHWNEVGSVKNVHQDEALSQKIFEKGVYLFFPSSRSEMPYWLNHNALPNKSFDTAARFSKRLRKPIYVERGLDELKQWMLTLLIDMRMDFQIEKRENGTFCQPLGDLNAVVSALSHQMTWQHLNIILRHILNAPSARFLWRGRFSGGLLGFQRHEGEVLPLEVLSAGQATLLTIFGTLLRYGDGTTQDGLLPQHIDGICLIDEIDAHMHIDLQYRALPALICMFPKVQFMMSSHSPLFVLGMEKTCSADQLMIVDLPSGRLIDSEAYSEFEHAFNVLQETTKFNQTLLDAVNQQIANSTKPLLITEGKTDVAYLKAAMKRLRIDLDVEFLEHQENLGGSKDVLNILGNIAKLKSSRPIIGIFDRDEESTVNKIEENNQSYKAYGNKVYAMCLPAIPGNEQCSIEHYFPESILKKTHEGRRLFLGSEFYKNGRGIDGKYYIPDFKLNKNKMNGVIDSGVYKDDDREEQTNVALTKDAFSMLIQTDEFIEGFDFESFRPVFDRLREILKSSQQ